MLGSLRNDEGNGEWGRLMSFRKLIFGISLVSRVLRFSRVRACVYFARSFDSRRQLGTTCGLFLETIIYCLKIENKQASTVIGD